MNRTVKTQYYYSIYNGMDEAIAHLTVYHRDGALVASDLWVHPDFRQKGLATKLMKEMLSQLGDRDIYLTVSAYTDTPMSNTELRNWYERLGFIPFSTFPGAMMRRGVAR